MTHSDDSLFEKPEGDMEARGELAEEDKDFLKSLEKMAEEAMDEAESPGKQ